MSDADPRHPPSPADPGGFATTRWSLIAAARGQDAPRARAALSSLCADYWYPLYAYIRRRGHAPEDALDLTQEFFARLLERDFFAAADPARGRFRAFLLAACKHFLANEHDRARAQKRGGGQPDLSLDLDGAEGRYGREPAHELTPERLFQRRWALTLLDRVLTRLREEYADRGKEDLFERLRAYLVGDRSAPTHAQVAEELGTTAGAVKVAVHRLRERYRELLRDEIAQTVQTAEQIEEEVRELFAALAP